MYNERLNILDVVELANKDKNMQDLPRRIIKLGEEYGELSQAYLSWTSKNNHREKCRVDVLEEAIDCMIVSAEIALSLCKDDLFALRAAEIEQMFLMKINKWLASKDFPHC